ncbi:2OG-Fe(II) oxygenase [Vibrio sp. RE86]|uniref:2OG-Fe(II) oxygenase n=1 Tax=Vibrio sp. RE86 TaxID=2607605 RepID=UPI001493D56C|nr:2OG-Fe(II) oxygenase [Vibrio sp. RE86]NOH78406.1 2OG-Fe(II) oxygenase [Vibrio sp. RE86]
MENTAKTNQSISLLEQARSLALPSREEVLVRAPKVQKFWDTHKELLEEAWAEWETSLKQGQLNPDVFVPDESLLDPAMRKAVTQAWQDPFKEIAVSNLLEEVAPGVFKFQLFDPERLSQLRHYLEQVADSNIPTRAPYGIVLNRNGAMLDKRSEGYLAAPDFQAFYRQLLDKYMRPIARMLFPEIIGYDTQTFGFSIQYQAGMDTSLRLHTDASSVTLNVNLNMPGEAFTGSELDYLDPDTGNITRLTFEPGVTMIHRGSVPHAAHPITSGTRTNFVMWLYGEQGFIPMPNAHADGIEASKRWTIPTTPADNFAPF